MPEGGNGDNGRARRNERTRAAIIETFVRLLSETPDQPVSWRVLADAADYTPAALYRYFASRNDLMIAAAESVAHSICDLLEIEIDLGQSDVPIDLGHFTRSLGKAVRAHATLRRALEKEAMWGTCCNRIMTRLSNPLSRALSLRETKDADAAARLVIGIQLGWFPDDPVLIQVAVQRFKPTRDDEDA
jgi:AcrR family transcriptional regulator